MTANILSMLFVLVLAVLFGWLAKRAWGSSRPIVRWPGVILAGLLTLVFVLVFVLAAVGLYRLSQTASNPVAQVKVSGTPEQIKRGEKLAYMCSDCHSTAGQPPLDGGKINMTDIPNGPNLGVEYAPNLTPATDIKDWSDGMLIRAIREGVDDNGRPLVVHPAQVFHNMSDDDVQALVAYLRSQPAVENPVNAAAPENGLNLLGVLMVGSGMVAPSVQPPITQPVVAPRAGNTAEYGQYLVAIGGCRDCHGEKLAGGGGGLVPAGPDLVKAVQKESQAEFVADIREEAAKAGEPKAAEMPWKALSSFAADDDLRAIYAYLQSLGAAQAVAK